MDLIILDTRNYDRSITSLGTHLSYSLVKRNPLTPIGWNDDYIDIIHDDPSRTLMGSRQENWFYRSLSESKERGAAWRIIGNQIIISRVLENDDGALSGDNWNVRLRASHSRGVCGQEC